MDGKHREDESVPDIIIVIDSISQVIMLQEVTKWSRAPFTLNDIDSFTAMIPTNLLI